MADDLDDFIRRVDLDRWLSSRFVTDAQARADIIALYAFDHELSRGVAIASNPLIAQIRLTWWREALDEIYDGRAVRAHPVARRLSDIIARRRLPRVPLDSLIEARIAVCDVETLSAEQARVWADQVGGATAMLAAGILDPDASSDAAAAGAFWALARLAHGTAALAANLAILRAAAAEGAKKVSPRAFPAIAHATLAMRQGESRLVKQARLVFAFALGRI